MIAMPKQDHYEVAIGLGFDLLCERAPGDFLALGAHAGGEQQYIMPVLNRHFSIDLHARRVLSSILPDGASEAAPVGIAWTILALHYLAGPLEMPPSGQWVSFPDLVDARGYESVYRARVIQRLCATSGRTRESFVAACERLGGRRADWGDEGFVFQVFPRLEAGIAWYAGDDEFPPDASVLYPEDILSRLPAEDVTVLAESLVRLLQGKGW